MTAAIMTESAEMTVAEHVTEGLDEEMIVLLPPPLLLLVCCWEKAELPLHPPPADDDCRTPRLLGDWRPPRNPPFRVREGETEAPSSMTPPRSAA